MSKYKVIIFDMDGVLVDTEAYYYNRRKTFL
ncbi:MAG: HAD family phosphatase, partial [Lactococcus sp.]|nr:HAD family phosphatase [Lactococcus sp.]